MVKKDDAHGMCQVPGASIHRLSTWVSIKKFRASLVSNKKQVLMLCQVRLSRFEFLFDQSIKQSVKQPEDQSQSINQPTNESTNQPTNQPSNHNINEVQPLNEF